MCEVLFSIARKFIISVSFVFDYCNKKMGKPVFRINHLMMIFPLQGYLCTICIKLLHCCKTQATIQRSNAKFFVVFSRYCKLLVYIIVQITTYTFCLHSRKRTFASSVGTMEKQLCAHQYKSLLKSSHRLVICHIIP